MSVFEFSNYKQFVLDHFAKMPKKGRGQFRRLATHLNVNPVIISQVFKGDRDLSLEQAYDCCEYFGFGKLERNYFVTLVQKERSGTHQLKKMMEEQLNELRQQSDDIKNRIKAEKKLTEEQKAQFYSNWYYSGIRLLSDVKSINTAEQMAEYFNLPLVKVRQVLEFLIAHNLVSESQGKLTMGMQNTHISKDSPLVTNHHRNWRIKAMKRMENYEDDELFFTGPMVLSEKVFQSIRKDLLKLIEKTASSIKEADSEQLACLNIDFMKF